MGQTITRRQHPFTLGQQYPLRPSVVIRGTKSAYRADFTDFYLYTDASTMGWGASLLQDSISGMWTTHERSLHINTLELRAIRLGLLHFTELLQGKTVAVFSDNATALSYLAKEGGTHSVSLNMEAQKTLEWAEEHSVKILTQFVKGPSNVLADCLSRRNQIISTGRCSTSYKLPRAPRSSW